MFEIRTKITDQNRNFVEYTKIKIKTPKKNIRNLAIKLHKKKETIM